MRERGYLEDIGVDEIIILKRVLKKYIGGRGFDPVQEWDRWRAGVKTVMDCRVT